MSHALPRPADPAAETTARVHAAMLDVVLAGGKLDRAVALAAEHIGATVAVAVPSAGLATAWPPHADLAALRRYAAQRVAGEPAPVPDGLDLELPIESGGEELGVAALLDAPPLAHAAAEVLHLTAATTVVALALDGASAAADRLGGRLLGDLIDREAVGADEVLARARRAGADLSSGAIAGCALHGPLPDRVEATVRHAFPGALVLRRAGRLHALLPAGDTAAALALADRLDVPFAIAPFEPRPERLGGALREAALAAALVGGPATAAEAHSGIHRLLVRLASDHPAEVRRFAAATVGPLVEHDARNAAGVLDTLQAYLDHNCNMNATATAIFAHRHTVAYRLERVRELTGLDPHDHGDREQLGLGLKADAVLRAAGEAP